MSLGVVLALLGTAWPRRANPALRDWFQYLNRAADGSSSCRLADCHTLNDDQWSETSRGYRTNSRGQWVPVPPVDVLPHKANLTGGAVACYDEAGRVVYCFVRSPET